MSVRQGGSYLLDPVTGELTPNITEFTAPPADDAEGQKAEPEPIPGAPASDSRAIPATDGEARNPTSETGEVSGADPAKAPEAAPATPARRRAPQKEA